MRVYRSGNTKKLLEILELLLLTQHKSLLSLIRVQLHRITSEILSAMQELSGKNPRPKFFLIAGTVQMVPNFPIQLPGYTIYYHSDYYYSQSIYENDSTTTDFYIGRIPCRNSDGT